MGFMFRIGQVRRTSYITYDEAASCWSRADSLLLTAANTVLDAAASHVFRLVVLKNKLIGHLVIGNDHRSQSSDNLWVLFAAQSIEAEVSTYTLKKTVDRF